MKKQLLDLDFAAPRRRVTALGLVVLAGGMLMAGLAAVQLSEVLSHQNLYEQRLASLAAAKPRPKEAPKSAPDARAAARYQAGRQVAQLLDSPWPALLGVIEVRPATDVALLAVEPSATKRTVNITAEARTAGAMLEHLAMLQDDKRLTGVTLVSHQQQQQAPGAPWRYQIQGSW